ncbi:putative manganese-dependent inorganic diphosphatase [Inconstantimicrobium porci]|uniref:inorganic diphosphatase n=1 Tax=Inconstantimicrobium porci TaxID=2652291 RepID=A0A7X2T1N0_9CLOT|nr:putative manganese-dependent inorganic diphosphatase [Inconstantimicrobium porci]
MKNVVYVTGHKNPDSDSICSAIAYAELKNKTSNIPAMPVRLGNVNRETQFILDYFKVKAPEFLETLKLKVSDLEIDTFEQVTKDMSLRQAWEILKKNQIKSIPVTDKKQQLIGMLSSANLTSSYMDNWDNCILAKSNTSLDNILSALSATVVYENKDVTVFPGKIVVGAMTPESMDNRIAEGDIAIIGDRLDAQEKLLNLKVSLMILTGSHYLPDNLMELAKKNNVTVISTPHDSFTTSRLIVQSVPVEYVMQTENLVSFNLDDLVEDVKATMSESRFRSYAVLDNEGKVVGSISRYHLISNKKKKVIQMDHNERSQSVNGLEDAEILEIVDHHRVADIQTANPIFYRCEPIGSTSTIVAKMYNEYGITPSKEIAGLLCGAIISDTLLFKSPTCTPIDEAICLKMAEIAGIDAEKFAQEMFKAGTSLQGKSVDEIFNSDFKPFNIGDVKVGVAQVNTMDIEGFMPLKEEMLNYMNSKCSSEGYDACMLLLTDIIKEGSQVLVAGTKPEIAELTFNVTLEDSTAYLPGVLSRKKQVVPPMTAAILNM